MVEAIIVQTYWAEYLYDINAVFVFKNNVSGGYVLLLNSYDLTIGWKCTLYRYVLYTDITWLENNYVILIMIDARYWEI